MTAAERSAAKRRDQKTAAAMVGSGATNRQVADQVGRSQRQVSRWKGEPQFAAMVAGNLTPEAADARQQRAQLIAAGVLARPGATCRDAAASSARSVSVVSSWLRDPAFTARVAEARGRQADAVGSTELAT